MAADLSVHPLALAEEPVVRWSSRVTTIPEIQRELARLWVGRDLDTEVDGRVGRHVAARTSVMNLVVVARRPETAEHASATIGRLAGRHPSRTLVVVPTDPDGPATLRALVEAHCVLPRPDAPETCAELIRIEAGGQIGGHLEAVVAPLLIHDLPVMVWWPDEPPFGAPATRALTDLADHLVVDGAGFRGDGLAGVQQLARLQAGALVVSDFALTRQSRWREAIASVFDLPELMPYLRYLRRVAITYATHDADLPPGRTNIVKPVYHVSWLASRLGLSVDSPLAARTTHRRTHLPGKGEAKAWVHGATLEGPQGEVTVTLGAVQSSMPPGTTLRVELLCERRGSELRASLTAEAETVTVRAELDGIQVVDHQLLAPRRTEVGLLVEAIELGHRSTIAAAAIDFAAKLTAEGPPA